MADVPRLPEGSLHVQAPQDPRHVRVAASARPQPPPGLIAKTALPTPVAFPSVLSEPPKVPPTVLPSLPPPAPNPSASIPALAVKPVVPSELMMGVNDAQAPGPMNGDEDVEMDTLDDLDEQDEDDDYKPKLPILRLKKLCGDDNTEKVSFEKQEASKNDSYCWVCHDGGDVLCCDKCPRVFHVQCSGLAKAPEGDEEWYCPVCKNIARKTKRSRPPNLKDLLLLAVRRMMYPGTEIFQKDVPEDLMAHYREYIFFPMHMGKIKNKVEHGRYQSTRAFLHDAEWILHNCIIYNGAKHALTKLAKGIVKICKEDMREVELCPSCYSLSVRQPDDWFCIPCSTPHRVVLAKVRGYPLWPAKLISETSDKCDVRFFGQHDRSLVPKSSIQELAGPPPTPTSKTQFWNIAMYELKKYRENINDIFEKMNGGKGPSSVAADMIEKAIKEAKPLKARETVGIPTSQASHMDFQLPGPGSSAAPMNNHHLPVSNYVPFSPQVVEVSVNLSDNEDGSMHGNSATLMHSTESTGMSEPSSPGSEPELKIDLGGSSAGRAGGKGPRDKHLPSKTRVAPSANHSLMGSVKRRPPHVIAGPDPPPTAQHAAASVFDTPKGSKKRKRKPGEALSALLTSLTERNLKAAGSDVASSSAANATPVQCSTENAEAIAGQLQEEGIDVEGGDESEEVSLDSKFSSIYHEHSKTAIAVVDPEQRRNRRRRILEPPPIPPKKVARVQKSQHASSTDTASETATAGPSKQMLAMMAQQIAAQLQGSPQSPIKPDVPSLAKPSESVPTSQPTASRATSSPAFTSTPAHTPAKPSSHKQTGSTPPAKRRARQPKGGGSSIATPPSQPMSTHTSVPSTLSHVQLTTTPSSSAHTSLQEVRGAVAAPAFEDSPEFSEGSGLLADTLRKVDRSFRARLNQIAGGSGSEDMGYQYFTEKVMSSIKTVLIEMLSMFESKGKMGAKHLKDNLHSAWPVPDSRSALGQLRKELLAELYQSLDVVRAGAELERQQVVSEVRRQAEAEKEIAVLETKKKKWCSYCWKEAQYNCCWNANYCNEVCQQAHWPDHMKECMQVQSQVPRTPAPVDMAGASTPSAKLPQGQLPVATMGQEQPGLMFVNRAQSISQNSNSSSNIPPMTPGATLPPAHQHHHHPHITHDHIVSSGMPMASIQDHASSIDSSPMEQAMTRIEQVPNENMLSATNPASPPVHIRSILLNQQSSKGPVITGTLPLQMNPSPVLGHPVISGPTGDGYPSLTAVSTPILASSSMSSDHSSSSGGSLVNINSLQSSQPPMSPATPPSDNPPSIQNPHGYTTWQYQHIGENYHPHSLPLLPAMQVSTPTSQTHAFFKPFGT